LQNINAKFYVIICKVHEKAIIKILKNDTQILSKLDEIITSQKQLDERLTKIERTFNNNEDIDPDSLKVIKM
jgi:chaperonin cofactor prefoldin